MTFRSRKASKAINNSKILLKPDLIFDKVENERDRLSQGEEGEITRQSLLQAKDKGLQIRNETKLDLVATVEDYVFLDLQTEDEDPGDGTQDGTVEPFGRQ